MMDQTQLDYAEPGPPPDFRWVPRLTWLVILYPLVPLALLYVQWLVGWAYLGHPPRPSLDDPKDIPPVDAFWLFGFLSICGVLPMLLLALGLVGGQAMMPSRRLKPWLYQAGIFVSLWTGSWLFWLWDPLRVMEWWMD